jgi:hypothetical protein
MRPAAHLLGKYFNKTRIFCNKSSIMDKFSLREQIIPFSLIFALPKFSRLKSFHHIVPLNDYGIRMLAVADT